MRTPPAGVAQREFRPHWGTTLAKNLDLDKLGLPVLNHRDGVFWIIDGQHRIYALKANGLGDEVLDCEVFEKLTDAEMAAIFDGRNTRKAVAPIDKFLTRCTAGYKRENDIRRAIETNGAKVSRRRDRNCLGAVSACGQVYDSGGEIVLGQTIRTLSKAYSGDPTGFDGAVIVGLGGVYNRYNGKTSERDMVARLAANPHGIRGVIQRANILREKTGADRYQCISAAIVEIYNRGAGARAGSRLHVWWKLDEKAEKATA
jgi:hypothetical protein